MQTSEFDYQLPPELIATKPAEPRDAARLLVMEKNGELDDKIFSDLAEILGEDDVLVLNNSKVIPARLFGKIGEREFEVLLLRVREDGTWESWVKPGRKGKIGDEFSFTRGLSATLVAREEDLFIIKFNLSGAELYQKLTAIGEMPIPPYILKARGEKHEERLDETEYQTVYSKDPGSVAAPTAGLHFTYDLLSKLHEKGVQIEYVTLHVGLGTFQPLNTEKIEDFHIHTEYYEVSPETANRVNQAKIEGKRIIGVGTTAVRVLESAATSSSSPTSSYVIPLKKGIQFPLKADRDRGSRTLDSCLPPILGEAGRGNDEYFVSPKSGETSIYIYPGYNYRFVDAIITNFHLPKSSLLLLVSAFAGQENIKNAYQHAIDEKYRYYSYGDAMFIK